MALDPVLDGEKVDLSVPVICMRFWKGILPIDGYHRLKLALDSGIILPSVVLDNNESNLVIIP